MWVCRTSLQLVSGKRLRHLYLLILGHSTVQPWLESPGIKYRHCGLTSLERRAMSFSDSPTVHIMPGLVDNAETDTIIALQRACNSVEKKRIYTARGDAQHGFEKYLCSVRRLERVNP